MSDTGAPASTAFTIISSSPAHTPAPTETEPDFSAGVDRSTPAKKESLDNGLKQDSSSTVAPATGEIFDRDIEAHVKALAGSAVSTSEVKIHNAARIKEIAAREENRTCADCGARGKQAAANPSLRCDTESRFHDPVDPRWASWNLGIFICMYVLLEACLADLELGY